MRPAAAAAVGRRNSLIPPPRSRLRSTHRNRLVGCRSCLALGIAVVVAGAPSAVSASPSAACDVGAVRVQAEQHLPEYDVKSIRVESGLVTLVFAAKNTVGTFSLSLRASGTLVFSSMMRVRLDDAQFAEISRETGAWIRMRN